MPSLHCKSCIYIRLQGWVVVIDRQRNRDKKEAGSLVAFELQPHASDLPESRWGWAFNNMEFAGLFVASYPALIESNAASCSSCSGSAEAEPSMAFSSVSLDG